MLKNKAKASQSLIEVGEVGVKSPTVSWAQQMKGGAHPFPFVALFYPFTAGLTERVFKLLHGEAQPRTHDFTATFCTICENCGHMNIMWHKKLVTTLSFLIC